MNKPNTPAKINNTPRRKHPLKDRPKWTDVAIVLLTGGIVFFAWTESRVTEKEWRTMEKQLELSERPWVDAQINIDGPFAFDVKWGAHQPQNSIEKRRAFPGIQYTSSGNQQS